MAICFTSSMKEPCAEIYSFNAQSQAMFRSIGFVQKDAEMFVYPLR